MAVQVAHARVQVFGRHIEPIAELTLGAKTPAQVDGAEHAAAARHFDAHFAQIPLGRPLDQVVHQPARCAGPGLDAAGAAQDLDALLVVQRDGGLCADRQPLAPVVEAVVQHEAAHRQKVPVARRVVRIGDRGVELRQVRQAARAAGLQLIAADHRGRDRHVFQRQVAEAADVGLRRRAARIHRYRRQHAGGLRVRCACYQKESCHRKRGGRCRPFWLEEMNGRVCCHDVLSTQWQVGLWSPGWLLRRRPGSEHASLREDYLKPTM